MCLRGRLHGQKTYCETAAGFHEEGFVDVGVRSGTVGAGIGEARRGALDDLARPRLDIQDDLAVAGLADRYRSRSAGVSERMSAARRAVATARRSSMSPHRTQA
jgi:hypothetical protein